MPKNLLNMMCLLLSTQVAAQNLIANPDFEDINTCCENYAMCSHEAWFRMSTTQPTTFTGTSLENRDKKSFAWLEMGTEDAPDAPFCLLTPMLCTMREGESYEVVMKVKPMCFVTNQIHLLFTDTMSINIKNPLEPSVILSGTGKKGMINNQEDGVIELRQVYTAKGNERFVILGLFGDKENIRWEKRGRVGCNIGYAIQHLSITAVNHVLDCDTSGMKKLIYKENRRHSFSSECAGDHFNLFPYLRGSEPEKEVWVDPRIKRFADAKKAQQKPVDNVLRNLNFDTDQSMLKPEAYKEVSRLVVILYNKKDQKVKLIGYTDNQGSDEHNMQLSIARAKAVYEYLIRKGIAPARITYEGKGATDPIDNNDTEAGRSNNRRVEFFLTD